MVKSLVKLDNTVLGYFIDDIYIPYRIYKYFCKEDPKVSITIRGKPPDVQICYPDLLSRLKDNNLDLRDIIFLPISRPSYKDVQSSFWELEFSDFYYYYACVSLNNLLGYISTKEDIFKCDCIYLNMIEASKKGCGNGTEIVNGLLNMVSVINGLSLHSSLDFWRNLGATIDKDNYFQLKGVKK